MPTNSKQYREQLYRLRAHPRSGAVGFTDSRDSFRTVYLSLVPFAGLEYFAEVSVDPMPGGLVFPVGFLLFWAFYYTYYRPGILENRLTAPGEFDLTWVPSLVLGILIWFMKVTFVELSHAVFFQWVKSKPANAQGAKSSAPGGKAGSRPNGFQQTQAAPKRPNQPPALLPPELVQALHTLGLRPGCNWQMIHKQYRSLAKQYHPDLNPDSTDVGSRFMKVDAAYHRLAKVRAKHFPG